MARSTGTDLLAQLRQALRLLRFGCGLRALQLHIPCLQAGNVLLQALRPGAGALQQLASFLLGRSSVPQLRVLLCHSLLEQRDLRQLSAVN